MWFLHEHSLKTWSRIYATFQSEQWLYLLGEAKGAIERESFNVREHHNLLAVNNLHVSIILACLICWRRFGSCYA